MVPCGEIARLLEREPSTDSATPTVTMSTSLVTTISGIYYKIVTKRED